MLKLFLAAVMAVSAPVVAHETDSPARTTADQINLAKDLPQTVVIRTSRTEPGKVEVVHVREKLAAGHQLNAQSFQQLAAAAESATLAYNSSNELDLTSSKNSWAFGLAALGLGAGLFLGSAFTSQAYASNYYVDPYYYGGYRASYALSPYYNYGGYNYGYSPYYSYRSGVYDYSYCNWNGYYSGY